MSQFRTISSVALCCAALLVAALAGCTTVHKTGYLQDYHRLGHVGVVPLEQVWIHPEFDIREYRTLYVAPVRIDSTAYRRNGQQDFQSAVRLAAACRAELERQIRGMQIFAFVSSDPYFSTQRHGVLTLETRITEFYSGNPKARKISGFGPGATEVQLEGKVIENKNCRSMVEFADRRINPGPLFFLDEKASSDSEHLIGNDLSRILNGIVKLFVFMRESGPAAEQR